MGWQSNALTHALAQRTINSFPILVWRNSVPPDIYKFFVSDIAAIKSSGLLSGPVSQKKKKKNLLKATILMLTM